MNKRTEEVIERIKESKKKKVAGNIIAVKEEDIDILIKEFISKKQDKKNKTMNDLETLNQMALQNKEIFMFPLENIIELSDLDKTRSKMKMLIDGGVANKLMENKYVGAFIVADKEQFYKMKERETSNEK